MAVVGGECRLTRRQAAAGALVARTLTNPVPMLPDLVAGLLVRELRAMQRELEAYPSDSAVWQAHAALPNTGGTLALHAAGNLLHFIGTMLGSTDYIRNRDGEFSRRDVPRAELHREIDDAIVVVERVLASLPEDTLSQWYPQAIANRRVRTGDFLMHLASHLAYHLGQMDYHRRMVTGDARGVGALAPAELRSAVPVDA